MTEPPRADRGARPSDGRHRSGAGPRRRRPPERRQVHAGQPDHRPPRGGRRGRPRRHPRPGGLRRLVERSRASPCVDTGGWEPDARGLAAAIAAQAEIAVDLADAVLFVVDATVGVTDTDEAVVKMLRASKKPVVLAANKVDDQRMEAEAYGLWNLGLGEPWPVSALHGRGSRRPARRRPGRAARAPGGARTPRWAARAGSRWSASRTSASPACSTSWPRRTGSSSTTSPAPPSTRSTS